MVSNHEFVAGVEFPDSMMARAATEIAMETETQVLYGHSRRVFLFASLAARQRGLSCNPELLYVASMFHDIGLTGQYATRDESFEVDGANAARDFLMSFDVARPDLDDVWDAIALHTTPEIARHKRPIVALLAAGVEMDVMGLNLGDFTKQQVDEICVRHPREVNFKYDIIAALYCGTFRRPKTSFGNLKTDVLAYLDHTFVRTDFCDMILHSQWES